MITKGNTLLVGDTQLPYAREDYLPFCEAVAEKYNCENIVHVGDLIDAYNWSRYDKDPYSDSIKEEAEKLRLSFELWSAVFPKMDIVWGNHDLRVKTKLNQAGLPEELLSVEGLFRQVFGFPEDWHFHKRILIKSPYCGTIQVRHGHEKGTAAVAGNTLRRTHLSTIMGHRHILSQLCYTSTHDAMLFDMYVGCGIDKEAIAFRYDSDNIARPIISCGVLVDGYPQLIIMKMGKDGQWIGKL